MAMGLYANAVKMISNASYIDPQRDDIMEMLEKVRLSLCLSIPSCVEVCIRVYLHACMGLHANGGGGYV